MKLNGVPTSGKRIALIDGVTVQLPGGAVYGKNKDGDAFWGVLKSKPSSYKDGSFTIADDAEFNWEIIGFTEGIFKEAEEVSVLSSGRKEKLQQLLDKYVAKNCGSEKVENKPYEFGSSTKVEETADGMRMTFSPQVSSNNGLCARYTLNAQSELVIREVRTSLMGITFSSYIGMVFVDTGSAVKFYQTRLSAQGEGLDRFKGTLIPVLKTVQHDPSERMITGTTNSNKTDSRRISVNSGLFTSEKFDSRCTPDYHIYCGVSWKNGVVSKFTALNYALLVSADAIHELHFMDYTNEVAGFEIDSTVISNEAACNIESERDRIGEILDCYNELELPSDRLCEELKKYIERYISGFSMTMTIDGKTTSSQKLTGSILFKMLLRRLYAIEDCGENAFHVYICGQLAMALPEHPELIYDMIGCLRADSNILADYSVQYTVVDFTPEEEIYESFGADDEDKDSKARRELAYQQYEDWAEKRRQQQKVEDVNHLPFDAVSSVTISGKTFVLTGEFEGYEDRDEVKKMITAKGGRCTTAISGKTDYVVVGALGGFGEKKIEDVQLQRSKGSSINLIRQSDLFDALNGKLSSPTAPAAPAKPENKSSSASVRAEANNSVRASLRTGSAAQPKANASSAAKPTSKEEIPAQQKAVSAVDAAANKQEALQKQTESQSQSQAQQQLDWEIGQFYAQIEKLTQTKAEVEENLRSLGRFKIFKKIALSNEIKALKKGIATAHKKLGELRKVVPIKCNNGYMSNEMKARVRSISSVLRSGVQNAMTASEIAANIGADYSNVEISLTVSHIENVFYVKVKRPSVNAQGKLIEREYTAYFSDYCILPRQ